MSEAWPWPAPPDDGAAAHLVPGLSLPSLALPSTAGVEIDPSRVGGILVLFVYPFTGTPGEPNPLGWDHIPGAHGSTPEAEGFRDRAAQFALRGAKVMGLSAQRLAEQEAFARRAALTFPLLSDEGFGFADSLRLPRFATGGVCYLKRLTLIARDGIVECCHYPVHPPHSHADAVLASLG
ncbi:MAG: peroxiredoxin [Hyphomicrobiaceae bacterium]